MVDGADRHTPTLTANDARGLAVRQVNYLRAHARQSPTAHIQRQEYSPGGLLVRQWDARPGKSEPDLQRTHGLSGVPLFTWHGDSGWRMELYGEAGQVLRRWDQRGSRQTIEYDRQLRTVARHEQSSTQPASLTIERLVYGDNSAQNALHNRCGQLVRHLDPAGSLDVPDFGLGSAPLHEKRRYLKTLDLPHWPDLPEAQDAMLEPAFFETQWEYIATGDQSRQTDARQHQQRFTFDIAGQLERLQLVISGSAPQTVLEQFDYHADGQLQKHKAGNGVISNWAFDPASGRLIEQTAAKGTTRYQHLSYSYDPVGNVTQITDATRTTEYFSGQRIEPTRTFSYNSRYQLIRATGYESAGASTRPDLPDWAPLDSLDRLRKYTQKYEYDLSENLTKLVHTTGITGQGHTVAMAIDATTNRCLSWSQGNTARNRTLHYDADGNLQTLPPAGKTLEWNTRNQLQSVVQISRTGSADDREHYAYSAQGNRLRKWQSTRASAVAHIREVRYSPGLEIKRVDDREKYHVIHLHAGRSQIRFLHWVEDLPKGIENDQMRYCLGDQQGSTVLELDSAAGVISNEGYYPFGGTAWWAATSEVQASYKTIRYSNKERDASGLYYYGARYYAPWMMRWVSPDPAGTVDGLNLYAMVKNNPMSYVDPTGQARGRLDYLDLAPAPSPLPVRQAALSSDTSLAAHFDTFNTETANMMQRAAAFREATLGTSGQEKKNIIAREGLKNEDNPDLLPPKVAHAGYTSLKHELAENLFFNVQAKPTKFPGLRFVQGMSANETATRKTIRQTMPIPGFNGAKELPVTLESIIDRIEVTDLDAMVTGVKKLYGQTKTKMHPFTEQQLRTHIQDSNFRLPAHAGVPGTHAEVLAQNSLLHRLDAQGSSISAGLRDTAMYTVRVEAPNSEFPSCDHCSGIVSPLIYMLTDRTQANRMAQLPIAPLRRRRSI